MSEELRIQEYAQELRDSLDIPVMIDHRQVDKIVINKLIGFRSSNTCTLQKQIDDILKSYFLSEEEFEKHVINKEPLK